MDGVKSADQMSDEERADALAERIAAVLLPHYERLWLEAEAALYGFSSVDDLPDNDA